MCPNKKRAQQVCVGHNFPGDLSTRPRFIAADRGEFAKLLGSNFIALLGACSQHVEDFERSTLRARGAQPLLRLTLHAGGVGSERKT
jgi:hypothetical protein